MLLTPREFDSRLRRGRLIITFIGMSGMGKSYRGEQLRTLGFDHKNCDNVIASRISELSQSDVHGLAAWMGQPYEPGYQEREAHYLELEKWAIENILASIDGNTVIDATGSVVYMPKDVLARLKNETLMVHLDANDAACEQLFDRYLAEPKPVVWGTSFDQKNDESNFHALYSSYPALLKFRLHQYAALADVTIPYEIARNEHSGAKEFLDAVKKHMRGAKERKKGTAAAAKRVPNSIA